VTLHGLAAGPAARAAGGPPAVLGTEWGDTTRALDHWLRRDGWRRSAAPGDEARWRGLACAHCGHAGLERHAFARWVGRRREVRAFARCPRCGPTGELTVPPDA
jgi:hypothetical protein